jgi:hypothetical protein
MFGMLGVFSEFERAMIQSRVKAGLQRAQAEQAAGTVCAGMRGTRLKAIGRPKVSGATEMAIRERLAAGIGMLKVATRDGRWQRHRAAGEARDGYRPAPVVSRQRPPSISSTVGGDVRREHNKNTCRFEFPLDRVTLYRANVINARFRENGRHSPDLLDAV